MIKLIPVKTSFGIAYINSHLIAAIDEIEADKWYIRLSGSDFLVSKQDAQKLLAELQGETKPQTALDDLVLTTLVSAQRDRTAKNARPMWRCYTDDGEAVNIFLNSDEPEKDSHHLFNEAGWGLDLYNIQLHQIMAINIQIAMKKNGRFWEVVKVRSKPESDMPEWAKENYLFDNIVTEEDGQEGGAE